MRRVSLTVLRRQLRKLINDVEKGEVILVTRRGRPVAKLLPHGSAKTDSPSWTTACERMMARLEEGASLRGLKVDRQELYRS